MQLFLFYFIPRKIYFLTIFRKYIAIENTWNILSYLKILKAFHCFRKANHAFWKIDVLSYVNCFINNLFSTNHFIFVISIFDWFTISIISSMIIENKINILVYWIKIINFFISFEVFTRKHNTLFCILL